MRGRRLILPAAAGAGVLITSMTGDLSAFWLAAGLICAVCAAWFFACQTDRRLMRCFGLLGAAACAAAALALRLNTRGATGWDGLALSLLAALLTGPAAGQLFIWLMQLCRRCQTPVRMRPGRAFVISLGLLLLCWLPVTLALFPGVTGYDMQSQMHQITSGEYVNGHPIAHTLLIGAFSRLGQLLGGGASLGVGLFMIGQTLCVACAMAYALYWLCLRRCPRVIWWLLLSVFALAPQHAVMAASLTKDVLFAAALLALVVELCRWLTEPARAARPGVVLLDLCLLLAAGLLRRNMVLAYLVLAILLLVRVRSRGWARRLLALVLGGMLLASGCETALKKAVDAKDPTINDTLAMPCQQLARVYHVYGPEHPVGYEIGEKLPWAHAYTPERADAAKRGVKLQGSERLISFLKLWGREALHFPIEYIDAFLFTNKAYWDIMDTAYAYTYDDEEYGPRGAMTVNHNIYSQLEQYDLLPDVQQLCDEWYTENACMQIPPVRFIIHPALWTWLLLFGLTWAIYEQKKAFLIAWALPAAYLATLMLGPCALIRYCYCIMLTAPVLTGALCTTVKEENPSCAITETFGKQP